MSEQHGTPRNPVRRSFRYALGALGAGCLFTALLALVYDPDRDIGLFCLYSVLGVFFLAPAFSRAPRRGSAAANWRRVRRLRRASAALTGFSYALIATLYLLHWADREVPNPLAEDPIYGPAAWALIASSLLGIVLMFYTAYVASQADAGA